jgi:hypothetical protein
MADNNDQDTPKAGNRNTLPLLFKSSLSKYSLSFSILTKVRKGIHNHLFLVLELDDLTESLSD